MSGRSIGSIIGGAIGLMIPGGTIATALIGSSIGGFVGGILFPDEIGIQDQTGPRMHDLKVTTATYGASIARVNGSYRISGNIFWSLPIKPRIAFPRSTAFVTSFLPFLIFPVSLDVSNASNALSAKSLGVSNFT